MKTQPTCQIAFGWKNNPNRYLFAIDEGGRISLEHLLDPLHRAQQRKTMLSDIEVPIVVLIFSLVSMGMNIL